MGHSAFDEIHAHRPRCVRSQLLQLQAAVADQQSEVGVGQLARQIQALRPSFGLRFAGVVLRLNLDATTCLLLH